jgi:hypothetical protein
MQYAIARESYGSSNRRGVGAGLWTVQGLLAALFLFAGVMKLVMPIEAMEGPIAFPEWFLRFIGVAETAGALGLILPGLTRIRTELTALAAYGLVVIMVGATGTVLYTGEVAMASFPGVVGVLCALVAYGRTSVAPHRSRRAVSD